MNSLHSNSIRNRKKYYIYNARSTPSNLRENNIVPWYKKSRFIRFLFEMILCFIIILVLFMTIQNVISKDVFLIIYMTCELFLFILNFILYIELFSI